MINIDPGMVESGVIETGVIETGMVVKPNLVCVASVSFSHTAGTRR